MYKIKDINLKVCMVVPYYDRLREKYPKLLKHAYPSGGEGWENIIDKCCNIISNVDPDTKAEQIKEKFGTLRFYVHVGESATDAAEQAVYNAVDYAEKESATTCQDCGNLGEERGGGWIKTLCSPCAIKHNRP